ncbi:MAG: T9SS type A sorting domain-containing protein [Bacteroidia bacterium]|nr:T9SS type A sorting domain-containing protein [Bacteroidia bacterium]HQU99675.1 T9SS type A sorting domain-containing protein [Bacteroidia bacterium]
MSFKITSIALLFCAASAEAQLGVLDSVFLGTGYTNEVYYNTQTMTKTIVPKNNWELGFQNNLMQASIIANHTYGVTVYRCPNVSLSDFLNADTTGLTTWTPLFNSDVTWNDGALNATRSANPFDFGWGTYDMGTHFVTGDSVFIIKLVTGPPGPGAVTEYRKLAVTLKTPGGDYYVRQSNLDNTNDITDTIFKADYLYKNFGYYSLRNNSKLDREPISTDWDILFTRYYENVQPVGYYPVAGILSNIGVQVAEASGVDVLTVNAANYTSQFSTKISEIGSDWKFYDQPNNLWVIQDSLTYFVKSQTNLISQITLTGFGGSATGMVSFFVTSIPTSVNEIQQANLVSMALQPNVCNQNTTLIFSSKLNSTYLCTITGLSGQIISQLSFNADAGLNQKQLDVSELKAGIYFVTLTTNTEKLTAKLIKN